MIDQDLDLIEKIIGLDQVIEAIEEEVIAEVEVKLEEVVEIVEKIKLKEITTIINNLIIILI